MWKGRRLNASLQNFTFYPINGLRRSSVSLLCVDYSYPWVRLMRRNDGGGGGGAVVLSANPQPLTHSPSAGHALQLPQSKHISRCAVVPGKYQLQLPPAAVQFDTHAARRSAAAAVPATAAAAAPRRAGASVTEAAASSSAM